MYALYDGYARKDLDNVGEYHPVVMARLRFRRFLLLPTWFIRASSPQIDMGEKVVLLYLPVIR